MINFQSHSEPINVIEQLNRHALELQEKLDALRSDEQAITEIEHANRPRYRINPIDWDDLEMKHAKPTLSEWYMLTQKTRQCVLQQL